MVIKCRKKGDRLTCGKLLSAGVGAEGGLHSCEDAPRQCLPQASTVS